MREITLIMFILVIITLQLLFISFYLNDLRQIAEIKVCKDNPTPTPTPTPTASEKY